MIRITEQEAIRVLHLDGQEINERTVRTAYRKLARENHPDVGGSEAAMTRINEANAVLTSPSAKKQMHFTHQDILNVVEQ